MLKWLERGLLATGLFFGGWSGLMLLEARFVSQQPIPQFVTVPHRAAAATSPLIARGTWIARLRAPAVELSATVLEGSDDRTLNRAAGHIEYTALPGESGNVGIAGHRDTTFRRVQRLKIGDTLLLTTPAKTFEYRIIRVRIVDPHEVSVLADTPNPTLTLVTCYPFSFLGRAPKRYIVSAELVTQEQ